mgnify:CR=1 FL=1
MWGGAGPARRTFLEIWAGLDFLQFIMIHFGILAATAGLHDNRLARVNIRRRLLLGLHLLFDDQLQFLILAPATHGDGYSDRKPRSWPRSKHGNARFLTLVRQTLILQLFQLLHGNSIG